MAELDYAFLADYARVDPQGLLTAVGASFTPRRRPRRPGFAPHAVAGRVRARIDEGPVPIRVEIVGPEQSYTLGLATELTAGPNTQPYRDNISGHIFIVDMQMPLPVPGLYVINLYLAEEHARRLAFDVGTAARPPM